MTRADPRPHEIVVKAWKTAPWTCKAKMLYEGNYTDPMFNEIRR